MAARKPFLEMKLNDKGAMVHKAQLLLQKHGSKIKANGVYSIGMRTAVESFQKRMRLKPTGSINEKTWEKLNAIPKKPVQKK